MDLIKPLFIFHCVEVQLNARTRLELRFRSGTGGILLVPDCYCIFSGCVFKVTKRTVENRYSLKSENVEMLLFMKYNLLRGGGGGGGSGGHPDFFVKLDFEIAVDKKN